MLKLYRPILTNKLTQKFSANLACAKTNEYGGMAYPSKIVGTTKGICPPGYAPFYKLLGMRGHNGEDLKAWKGEPVYHCANFEGVMYTETDSSGGIGVDVVSKKPVLSYKGTMHHVKIRYWHLLTPIGWDKKEIKPGDMIGLADSTGASSGHHLHFAPKWCSPDGKNTIARNNGYLGAFDPAEFYHRHLFIKDILGLPHDRLTMAQRTSKLISSANNLMNKILRGRQ